MYSRKLAHSNVCQLICTKLYTLRTISLGYVFYDESKTYDCYSKAPLRSKAFLFKRGPSGFGSRVPASEHSCSYTSHTTPTAFAYNLTLQQSDPYQLHKYGQGFFWRKVLPSGSSHISTTSQSCETSSLNVSIMLIRVDINT